MYYGNRNKLQQQGLLNGFFRAGKSPVNLTDYKITAR